MTNANKIDVFAEDFIDPPKDTSPQGLRRYNQYVKCVMLVGAITATATNADAQVHLSTDNAPKINFIVNAVYAAPSMAQVIASIK